MSKLGLKIKQIWSDKDERNLFLNIILAFIVKGFALLISLFSMPLYIRYFDNDAVLGMWYTILSLLSWITVCDLGLGNGLRNRLTEAISAKNSSLGKGYVSSTYALLILIIIPVLLIGSILLSLVDYNAFFGISKGVIDSKTLKISIIILFNGIGINFVLKTINSIIYAMQKSSINNIIALLVSALPLLYVAFFNGTTAGENLFKLSLVHVFAVNFPLLAATLCVFLSKKMRDYAPSIKHIDIKIAKGVVGFGLNFFLAQIFLMCLMSTNEIMITKMFSSADVVGYSVYYKLFTVVGSLFMLALTPLWSKVTKDFAEKKYKKIQTTNHFLYLISLCAILAQFVIVPILQWVVNIWLQEDAITVNYTTAAIFAGFGGIYVLNVVLTTVANGIGKLKSQILFYGIGAALKIPVCILLKLLFENWNIVVLYNCVVLLCFCVYQIFWIERKIKEFIKQNDEGVRMIDTEEEVVNECE